MKLQKPDRRASPPEPPEDVPRPSLEDLTTRWFDKLGDTFIKGILCGLWATLCFTPVSLAHDGELPTRWELARFFLFGLAVAFLLSYGKSVWRILRNHMGSHRRVD